MTSLATALKTSSCEALWRTPSVWNVQSLILLSTTLADGVRWMLIDWTKRQESRREFRLEIHRKMFYSIVTSDRQHICSEFGRRTRSKVNFNFVRRSWCHFDFSFVCSTKNFYRNRKTSIDLFFSFWKNVENVRKTILEKKSSISTEVFVSRKLQNPSVSSFGRSSRKTFENSARTCCFAAFVFVDLFSSEFVFVQREIFDRDVSHRKCFNFRFCSVRQSTNRTFSTESGRKYSAHFDFLRRPDRRLSRSRYRKTPKSTKPNVQRSTENSLLMQRYLAFSHLFVKHLSKSIVDIRTNFSIFALFLFQKSNVNRHNR